MSREDVVLIGLGEVGQPLMELIQQRYSVIGVDVAPVRHDGPCAILHICYPFGRHFVQTTIDYIRKYDPALTIINGTVAPGTTRRVYAATNRPIVYSPIRGKHANMKQDMLTYAKFIGGIDREAAAATEAHFQSIGLKTKIVGSPETAELAKLTETTYFGVLIAWAQEVSRYCRRFNVDYDEVVSFYDEIPFLPRVRYSPGVIGGHCVMPNIEILKQIFESDLLDAIESSNEQRKQQGQPIAV
jgi:UDP-N-acetyl-D-mannosaminuronate dehydrogenase